MAMFVDAAASKLLAAIILTSAFSAEMPPPQERINAVNQNGNWLVFNRLADENTSPFKDRIFHVFIKKTNAEVIDIVMNWRIQNPSRDGARSTCAGRLLQKSVVDVVADRTLDRASLEWRPDQQQKRRREICPDFIANIAQDRISRAD